MAMYFERVLFVCGDQNAGKSYVLRDMYADMRFGRNGAIPKSGPLSLISLSNERCLFIRSTSPHEANETPKEFMDKVDHEMSRAKKRRRFNFASAVQPNAFNQMFGIVQTCSDFKTRFSPERFRVCFIDPRQDGAPTSGPVSTSDRDALRALGVELCTIDARRAVGPINPNGLFLADFFDFT